MDKIEKIRHEIERRMKIYKESNYGISLRYQELEELLSFLDTLSEEPDKSLEEAIMEYYGNIPDDKDKVDAARHFAEWGAEHLRDSTKIIDKSLEEAADTYAEKHGFRVPYDGSNNYYDEVDVKASKEGFIAGWKCRDDQMLKEAVEGYVNYYEDSGGILMAEAQVGCPYHNGDKVRIIVLKEEE